MVFIFDGLIKHNLKDQKGADPGPTEVLANFSVIDCTKWAAITGASTGFGFAVGE